MQTCRRPRCTARLCTWVNSKTPAGPSRAASVIIGSGRLDTRRRGARDGPATGQRGQQRRRRSSGRSGAALTQIPDRWRCKQVLIQADRASDSHALITTLARRVLDFSVGYPITEAGCEQHRRWPAGTRRRHRGDGVAGPEPLVEDLPWDARDRACAGNAAPRCDPGRLQDPRRLLLPGLHHQHAPRATGVPPKPGTGRTLGSKLRSGPIRTPGRAPALAAQPHQPGLARAPLIAACPARPVPADAPGRPARAAPRRAQDAARPTAPGHCSPSPAASPVANARCSFSWPSTGPGRWP